MILPRKVLAVIFDMDGLIFDSEVLYRDVHIAAAEEAGHEMPLSFFLTTIGLTSETARLVYGERYGHGFDYDAFAATVSTRFHLLAETELRMKEGVVELLDVLDAAGITKAIATSSSRKTVQRHLARHGLSERFQAIAAREDYARGKPSPDPFLKAAERLAIDPGSCLALEDSHNGVRAASSAGMMTIMVPDLLVATEEMKALCVCIAKDLHEVRTSFPEWTAQEPN
jgi:HAD superfamily hydrolase (TIGR01509 family)